VSFGVKSASSGARDPTARLFPVGLDATKKYFEDQNGNPCFGLGDAPQGMVVQLVAAQVEQYLSDRASRGINIIWWYPVDNIYSSSPPNNANGDAPFSGGDFLGMSSQTAYWNYVDHVMQRCLAWGMTVVFNPMFVGLNGTSGYLTSVQAASTATLQGYANFLGARYGGFPNLIWLIGGDADPNISGLYSQINIFATALKSADTGNHLFMLEACRFSDVIGAAPNGGYSSSEGLTAGLGSVPSWLSVNWVYQHQAAVLAGAQRCYPEGFPCFMGETDYEGDSVTAAQLRGEAYNSILGGCTLGYMFGNAAIWPFGSANSQDTATATLSPWQGQLSSQGSTDLQRMGKLFRSRRHNLLVPDISNAVMTTGSTNGSVCARTNDGQTIIAYLPSNQTVTIDMTKITDASGFANCNWFNPMTGAVTAIGNIANTGTHNFTSPDSNDWVLVIDSAAAAFRTPGT